MGFSGRLEGIAPSDIFQIISQNRMTGTLIARCQDGTAMVVFSSGQIIEAASDAPRESLGSLLVSQGTVSEAAIQSARELRKQGPDRPLGAVLVDMAAIDQKALEAVVLKQIGQIVQRLMSCEDGFFTFDRGEVAVKRKLNTGEFSFPSGLSPEFLIMERARAADEERRKGGDRRAAERQQASALWDGVDRRKVAPEPAPAVSKARFPGADVLRRAMDAVARQSQKAAAWARERCKSSLVPTLNKAWDRFYAFSPDGRALLYTGAGAAAAGVALIVAIALSQWPAESELLVTGRIVNIRADPRTEAKVVAKAARGESITSLSYSDGWHKVRTRAGETGYVWQKLVERKEVKARVSRPVAVGGGVLLAAGLLLLGAGAVRKRRAAARPPRILRAVK